MPDTQNMGAKGGHPEWQFFKIAPHPDTYPPMKPIDHTVPSEVPEKGPGDYHSREVKQCPSCSSWMPLTSFSLNRCQADGRQTQCKECSKKNNSRRTKKYMREKALRSKYGLRPVDYDRMYHEQEGCCMICGVHQSETDRFHVDHDHETDAVRALLCSHCNKGLGQFKDDPDKLRRAADYLEFASK